MASGSCDMLDVSHLKQMIFYILYGIALSLLYFWSIWTEFDIKSQAEFQLIV